MTVKVCPQVQVSHLCPGGHSGSSTVVFTHINVTNVDRLHDDDDDETLMKPYPHQKGQ